MNSADAYIRISYPIYANYILAMASCVLQSSSLNETTAAIAVNFNRDISIQQINFVGYNNKAGYAMTLANSVGVNLLILCK